MPRVLYLTTAAGPDEVIHEGSVRDVSKEVAKELIDGGFAREVSASEAATLRPSENSTRRGRGRAVSGPDEEA